MYFIKVQILDFISITKGEGVVEWLVITFCFFLSISVTLDVGK
jgi:hypothetical protein